jgi:hypothetical protein
MAGEPWHAQTGLGGKAVRVLVVEDAVSEYTIRPLSTGTWDAVARLCEKHSGMGFGECWCTWCGLIFYLSARSRA